MEKRSVEPSVYMQWAQHQRQLLRQKDVVIEFVSHGDVVDY